MTPSVRRRWPWFLLVASLALNMLAGGFVVARAFLPPPPPPPGPEHMLERVVDEVSRRLSPADAAILRKALDDARPLFVRMRASREEFAPRLRMELMANPFDAVRMKAMFDSVHTRDATLRDELETRLVDTLSRLSPEGRLRLAESRLP
ncbi:periplasmic heavy metal sensor [Azospirillum sp. YIM B02556]|uniref:Periplasmic heavy metal sensor n=1 Tax=Azospirillum endophyticum TaxID=2800326 RepID=A0ABS1F0U2_9PROT|nr:periplasmic heavy metal sensor [Azospirillum endophyticum]MBK1837035.1 periplasmic heavy metal sensor [Azospirillum endophyticum]